MGVRPQGNEWADYRYCSGYELAKAKKDLFEHLDLDNNGSQNTRMWPMIFSKYDWNYRFPAEIYVDLYVTSIINVDEKAQSLTLQVKMITEWPNRNMLWNTGEFCGIKTFVAPKNMFWAPDIEIMESLKTEFGTKDFPNVLLFYYGYTISVDFLSLTTACKMDLYKFPFDTQSCNITFQSTSYPVQEITIKTSSDENSIIHLSHELFQAQGEWELLSINYSKATLLKGIEFDQLIYQIKIKRRPLLYVINIIIPVFFFFVLDVASFFIDTNGEDKLSFKVTLLLSISVMLLILSNTLPSTSEQIPLIGIYCSAIFCLIGISIVETILVNYLKSKGAKRRSVETTSTVSDQDGGVKDQQNPPASVRDQNEEQSYTLDLLNQILIECRAATQRNQQQKTCLSLTGVALTRVARIIDVTFLVLYIITTIVFLSVLGKRWIPC
ncbi:hypothetical protein R3I94_002488 [Phoxinus phoxinus]